MTRCNESEIIDDLRQTESATKRKHTIRQFTKALRREDRFQPAWDAAGGASGLARLMAEFSIRDVRDMCKRLGWTASAQKAQPQRRAALGELVTILYEGREDDRPLASFYQDIIPACNLELVQKFEKDRRIEWTPPQTKRLFLGHREQHEDKFLGEIFSKDKNIRFYQHRRLFRGNIGFCEKILTILLAKEGKVHVPSDLIDEVAMPVLRRLLKSRYDDGTRIKYLSLVLQCVQEHEEEIAGQLVLRQGGLLQYTVDRWAKAADDSESKRQYESCLVQAIELLPKEKSPIDLERIRQTLRVPWELDVDGRYDFFRLFILHHKDYKIDIESDSEQDLSRLRNLPERSWPSDLFFTINYKKSLRLFEKLESLFPKNDFLQVANQSGTILNQSQGHIKHSGFGDVEIVRALLICKSNTQDEHPGWSDRAIGLINERKTNAQQAREAVERAYWARSALNLCVAVGDLQTLNDTIIWSRRFIKDSLTSYSLFSVKVFKTKEIEEVLGAMPDERVSSPEAVVSFTSALRKKYIEFADYVLINIVETATLAVGEPGFKVQNWTWLFNLVMAVTGQRMSRLEMFFKNLAKCSEADRERCQRYMMEIVWKPTTDLLIEAGAVVRNPALATAHGGSLFDSLTTSSNRESVKGSHVYRLLSRTSLSPPLLAELARFLIDRMRERLGSEAIRAQMQDIVFVIDRLASSDQPSLACPFIRDLVLDNEGAKESSSWHRHLLSVGFLSVLPAKAAKEVLYTMASAIKEKMREQNQNTDAKEEAERSKETTEDASTDPKPSQRPSIKVTTVKMLAQILQYNLFMDPSSSCEILVGLLAEARHIDIRITITNSLFSILEEPTCPATLRKRILDALEEYIIPAAAQLNERRGLTEADWVAASTQDTPLPEIGNEIPLLKLLILKVRGQSLNEEDKKRLASLVMGAIEQSAVNNTRWMKLFLAKNNFSLDEEIPHLPVHLTTVSALYGQLQPYTPVSVFNMVRSAALINIDPSPGIQHITKAIQEDPELVNSKAGKHWVSQFSNPGRDSFKFGILLSAAMVQQSPADRDSKLAENGVSLQMLQSFVIEYTKRLLKIGQADMVMTLVMRLGGGRFEDRQNWNEWRENSVPTIKQIISKTEKVQELIRNKEVEPRRLPSVFRMRLRTIPVPLSDAKAEEEQTFLEELYKLIGDLGGRQYHPYHMDFQKLKEEFDYWPLTQSFGRVALNLAELQDYDLASTEQPTLKDYLCWEVIGHILTKAKDPKDENVVQDVRQLMRKWETCEDEAMRSMGMKFKGLLKDHAEKTWYKRE
ncbi:uncharacterized protein BKA55DRAFT_557084 [Fusarium redolens]|uniref:Uncharacterized protein n=1 Tax=Fusarium redolens TaxID=48865 RepID=A0A9P9HX11_FUSRE|nr:uncharacterized protein BKA55DRAFT_557084 [Fusarium redolens]KAH7264816.1 hypothetical protein BKA55DRAFT_557084 [Fusarium redolens]